MGNSEDHPSIPEALQILRSESRPFAPPLVAPQISQPGEPGPLATGMDVRDILWQTSLATPSGNGKTIGKPLENGG